MIRTADPALRPAAEEPTQPFRLAEIIGAIITGTRLVDGCLDRILDSFERA